MKILILGIFRTGSTALQKAIQQQGYTSIFEPFNSNHFVNKKYKYPLEELKAPTNIVVKCLTDQKHSNSLLSYEDFYCEFSKEFDKVILLSRHNQEEHLLSHLNQLYMRHNGLDSHTKYELNTKELYKMFSTKFIENSFNHLKEQYVCISNISKRLGVNITYYQDLYNPVPSVAFDTLASLNLQELDIIDLASALDYRFKYQVTEHTLI